MKVTYDSEVDVLRILFRNAPIDESDEDKPGVILDYDKEGNIVGLEVLNASLRIVNPRPLDYSAPFPYTTLFRSFLLFPAIYAARGRCFVHHDLAETGTLRFQFL